MLHSIIIPCSASRLPHLRACVASIARSKQVLGIKLDLNVTAFDPQPTGGTFNKSRALNTGIDNAGEMKADILTFLDADAIVSERCLEGVTLCDWSKVTRLC